MKTTFSRFAFAAIASLVLAFQAVPSARADAEFAVESFAKYDREASSYMVTANVNLVVVKKASSDFVIWTRGELAQDRLAVIEAYVRHQDPSLGDANAIFISGMGRHTIDTMYGTISFSDGEYGLVVDMPRTWSHLDYGRYTDAASEPETPPVLDPEPSTLTLTKTVNGGLWRVRCDYMDVEGQVTYKSQKINGTYWKRDWIKNPGGTTSAEGHRLNKCGDAEHWVIWTDTNGVPYRMDEIKSGATGSTLPTVVYRPRVEMSDEQIANIGNPDHPEYVTNYMKNFQDPIPYSEIKLGERIYWITFNGKQVWYHSGITYEAEPTFVVSVDGVEYTLTGGASVTIPDLEPGIHEISESENPLYSLGKVEATSGGIYQATNSWTVQLVVDEGEDIQVTWPNVQPEPRDPPSPPPPPHVDPEPDPEPDPDTPVVPTLCELLDFGKRFSAVVFGDLATSGGDCEGALLVWGNATLPNGYSVAIPVVGEPVSADVTEGDALVVGGDIAIGHQDINGAIVYGGAWLGPDRWDADRIRHVVPVTLDRAGNVPADGSGRTAADLLAAVTEVSAQVAEWDADGTLSTAVDGSLILTGTNALRNVFAVTAEEWSGTQRDWIFDVPAGSKIVVNVTGAFVDIAQGRMVLPDGVSRTDVLVNYVNATYLSFFAFDHEGTLLAPFASGSFTGGSIEGIAILGGDVATREGFEFHNYGTDVFFCEAMPEIVVTATAADAPDGAIAFAEPGTDVDVSVTVSNPSAFWLRAVTLTDSTGATLDLGDLAPGGSVTTLRTLSGAAEGRATYTTTATAKAYAASDARIAFAARPIVTASDVAVVDFVAGASSGGGAGGSGSLVPYNPTERVDYEVSDMWFSCIPTFAGETFTVNVRVKNNGEVDGNGAFLGIYLVGVDHEPVVAEGEAIEPVRAVELGGIPAGSSRVYSFGGLVAPDASGVCRVIAFADMGNVQLEWSKGDNQNNLTYELSQVAIHYAIDADGVTLTWSNGWGQLYSILGSNDLEDWNAVVTDIPSARDTDGLVENTQFVSFDTGYRFFKLHIDRR